jgi:ribonuclease-3
MRNRSYLTEIEKIIGYRFKDKDLGNMAITTRAFSNEHSECPDNQALEYLGDAVLSLVTAEQLYKKWPQLKDNIPFNSLTPEGVMTKIRQEVVNNQYLADYAYMHGLCKSVYDYPDNHNGLTSNMSSCSGSDIIEALIAAIYLDNSRSLNSVKRFVLDFLDIGSLLDDEKKLIEAVERKNPKDVLIHKYQKLKQSTPNIEYPEFEDKFNKVDNTHHFILGISINGILLPGVTGEGANKAIAEYEAADKAYGYLDKINWDINLINKANPC